MHHIPNLQKYVDAALYYDRTPEDEDFWYEFIDACNSFSSKIQEKLISALPRIENYLYPGPFDEEYAPYAQILIIAKYWHRFGRLPDVELLKELRKN